MKARRKRRAWTPDEDELVRSLYRKSPLRVIARLVDRPESSVCARAKRFGLSVTVEEFTGPWWTPDDDARLKELYGKLTRSEVARLLNRSKDAITARAGLLGLCRPHDEYWSEDYIRFLEEHYPFTSNARLAEILRRPKIAIMHKASRLGLRKSKGDWYSDKNIARFLAVKSGRKNDTLLREELLNYPSLLDVKRKQLQLMRIVRSKSQQGDRS